MNRDTKTIYDVIIIGGSYAGLSAALALGRSLRTVLVIDGGLPCNRFSPHSHNMLTHDGAHPGDILAAARADINKYPTVDLLQVPAIDAGVTDNAFFVTTAGDRRWSARKIIFATGVRDLLPATEGFAECWGKSIIHCPYCHGYEVHSTTLGVLANGDTAFEFGRMIKHWSKDLTIFTNGSSTIEADKQTELTTLGIAINEHKIARFAHREGSLIAVEFEDGPSQPLNAMFARLPFEQHSSLPVKLGCEIDEHGFVRVNEWNAASVPGIYAAGDNCSGMRSVANAIAAGGRAAAMLNREMIIGGH